MRISDWSSDVCSSDLRKPFFLYMPFVGAHFPLMAPAEDVAKFKGRYMRGWEAVRRERFERQKKLGIIAADAELPAALPGGYDWNKLSAEEKDRFDRSEEHTSELQSLMRISYAVFCLKKKKKNIYKCDKQQKVRSQY